MRMELFHYRKLFFQEILYNISHRHVVGQSDSVTNCNELSSSESKTEMSRLSFVYSIAISYIFQDIIIQLTLAKSKYFSKSQLILNNIKIIYHTLYFICLSCIQAENIYQEKLVLFKERNILKCTLHSSAYKHNNLIIIYEILSLLFV